MNSNSNLPGDQGPTKARSLCILVVKIAAIDSASDLDSEKDHEKVNLKDILQRKLQEKLQNKAEKSEGLDQLESWDNELSAAGFSVEMSHLTSKHCTLEDSEPATPSSNQC